MIKEVLHPFGWKLTILYDCTCDDIDEIIETLIGINCPSRYIKEALDNLETCNLDIGLTYSNFDLKSSVMVINRTSSKEELINTISHEYFHLMAHLSKALDITDEEELASLNGYLNMLSYRIVQKL